MSEAGSSLFEQQTRQPTLPICAYRCVCGESFAVERKDSGSCPKCGRHYTPAALAANFAETMTIVTGSSSVHDFAAGPETIADDLVGKTLGHFRIVNAVGRGGMGTVYQAVDESLQRYVALKVIRMGGSNPEQYERLVREARAQARVSHPHVVHIYYIGLNESSPFFAMELINGQTLAERLREGPLPFSDVIRFGMQIVSALERAAEFDIIHGDIKPSNILQVDPQTVKISDFGLSQRLSQSDGARPLAGTPSYLSPESTRGEATDIRSDMYSLGITLFELTFGRLPYVFAGATLQENLDVHVYQQPSFPNPWPNEVPGAWRDVLNRMLAKEPQARYPTYRELAEDLRKLMPVTLVQAAPLPRFIAWLLDFLMLGFLQASVLVPATLVAILPGPSDIRGVPLIASVVGFVLATLAFLLGVYIQCSWGRTPGKSLFQLRIVDRHGLPPPKSLLALRFVFQFLPLTSVFSPLLDRFGLAWLDLAFGTVTLLIFLTSALMIVFTRQSNSLHDRILGTRVVVDTQ